MVNKYLQSARAPLDVDGIVKFFGGPDELSKALKRHGIVVLTVSAIEAWMRRGHIPYQRRADLEVLARTQEKHFKLDKFKKFPAAPATIKSVGV